MALAFGERLTTLTDDGRELHAPVFDENQVRAAAGLTMVIGAVAFSFAYFDKQYIPLQVVTSFFFADFSLRLIGGLRASPVGNVARALTRRNAPQWVSAKPKRFAWQLGLALSLSMTVITNSGIRGWLPRSICLVCLTLMWSESVLGLCIGCELHAFLCRHGWASKDPDFEICANGVCELPR